MSPLPTFYDVKRIQRSSFVSHFVHNMVCFFVFARPELRLTALTAAAGRAASCHRGPPWPQGDQNGAPPSRANSTHCTHIRLASFRFNISLGKLTGSFSVVSPRRGGFEVQCPCQRLWVTYGCSIGNGKADFGQLPAPASASHRILWVGDDHAARRPDVLW